MLKLVNKPAKKLGATGGALFHELIKACIQKDANYFRFMNNMRNLLSGKHWKNLKKQQKEELKLVVNLAHAHIRSLVPTVFFKNPTLDCAPTAPMYVGKEQTWNSLLNNTLDKMGFAEECKKIALDACLFQEAVMKDIVNKPLEEATEVDKRGPVVWGNRGAPAHIRVNPSQLIVDYLSKDRDLDNARFIALRYKRTFQEIKNHPVYGKNVKRTHSNVDSKPTTGNSVTRNPDDDWEDPEDFKGYDREELVTIYEVWVHEYISNDGVVKLREQMFVLLEDQDMPIMELTPWSEVMVEGFDKYPVTRCVLNPVPDAYPVSELDTWQGLQMSVNWIMSRLVNLVENDRLLFTMDATKVKNAKKVTQQFYNGRGRELVEVTGDGAIELIQPSFAGRDNYSLINLVNNYIQQVAGLGQNRRGGAGIRTAREAHIIEAGVQIKTDEKVDTFEKFLLRVVEKSAMICRGLASRDEGIQWVLRIAGDIGTVKWENFTAEDVSWIPEIRFRVNSFRKQDTMEEMQKLAGMFQQSLVLRQQYGPQIRSDILFSRMLEASGVFDSAKIVGSQDAETMYQMVEITAMMDAQAMQMVDVQEGENHIAHMQIMDAFRTSTVGQQLLAGDPVFADKFETHYAKHQEFMMEMQKKAGHAATIAQNPFAAIGGDNQNAMDQAADVDAGDRLAGIPRSGLQNGAY